MLCFSQYEWTQYLLLQFNLINGPNNPEPTLKPSKRMFAVTLCPVLSLLPEHNECRSLIGWSSWSVSATGDSSIEADLSPSVCCCFFPFDIKQTAQIKPVCETRLIISRVNMYFSHLFQELEKGPTSVLYALMNGIAFQKGLFFMAGSAVEPFLYKDCKFKNGSCHHSFLYSM